MENTKYIFLFDDDYTISMPSNVVQRNLKRKKATQRKRAVAKRNRTKVRARVVTRRRITGSSIRTRPKRLSLVGVALSTFLVLNPSLRNAFAGGHPGPPSNPAKQAGVKRAMVSGYHQRSVNDRASGFSKVRVGQRITKRGPVVYFEKTKPNKESPVPVQVGIAQDIKISAKTLLKLGVRSPKLSSDPNWGNTDFGLIFVSGKNSVEVHRRGGKEATRFSVGRKVSDSTIEASFMEADYLGAKPAGRIGISKLEKSLGINLRGLSTEMGITSFGGGRASADVKLVYPTANMKFGIGGMNLGTGKPRVAGFIVIGL